MIDKHFLTIFKVCMVGGGDVLFNTFHALFKIFDLKKSSNFDLITYYTHFYIYLSYSVKDTII